jgi:hypothetical protein
VELEQLAQSGEIELFPPSPDFSIAARSLSEMPAALAAAAGEVLVIIRALRMISPK